jgi:translation initiation factor IF-2
VGDFFMVGSVFGKVRAMLNDRGEKVDEAAPSSAVIVLGLDGLPDPGDSFQAVTDTEKAKQIVEFREERDREQAMSKSARLSLEQYQEQMRSGEVKELPIILKCDVQGSMEVLVDSLGKLSAKKVKLRIVRSGVGAISESDVLLATTANAIIIGFNVRPERTAAVLAEREHIDVRLHTVIYELVDEITKARQVRVEAQLQCRGFVDGRNRRGALRLGRASANCAGGAGQSEQNRQPQTTTRQATVLCRRPSRI